MEFTKDIEFNMNPIVNKELEITYNGFLSGSDNVWIVYGFGDSWEHTTELKMEKYFSGGFSAKIKLLDYSTFNFCFKNDNYEWDNNNSNNYITQIDSETSQETNYKFDVNELINDMLKPLSSIEPIEETSIEKISLNAQPIDLGVEVANALSQIENLPEESNLVECLSISEILSGSVFDETPIEVFEENQIQNENIINNEVNNIVEQLIENTKNKVQNIDELEISDNINQIEESNIEENSLVPNEKVSVSIRKLSKFYLMKKRIKLALYKAFIKLPKMIFGLEDNN